MKQNHVCVICEKLYTIVRDLELHVTFCWVQRRKFNKKMFKRMNDQELNFADDEDV